jgi:hypothetical protein
MARTTDQVDDRLASVRRARIDTQTTITRKLTEIAALRTAYANEGRLIDKLLDERMDAAVAQAMADTATTATPPAPPRTKPNAASAYSPATPPAPASPAAPATTPTSPAPPAPAGTHHEMAGHPARRPARPREPHRHDHTRSRRRTHLGHRTRVPRLLPVVDRKPLARPPRPQLPLRRHPLNRYPQRSTPPAAPHATATPGTPSPTSPNTSPTTKPRHRSSTQTYV